MGDGGVGDVDDLFAFDEVGDVVRSYGFSIERDGFALLEFAEERPVWDAEFLGFICIDPAPVLFQERVADAGHAVFHGG